MFIIFTFIISVFSIQCTDLETQRIYSIEDAFECIESIPIDKTTTTSIQNGLSKLLDGYVFKDILQSPPQPKFDMNYFQIVNIDEQLKKLQVEKTKLYEYICDVQKIIDQARDYHLTFTLTSSEKVKYYYDMMYAILPFTIDIVDGKVVLYKNSQFEKNGHFVPDEISENVNVPVKFINGKDPIEFIQQFGEKNVFLKSPHGRFSYALETMSFIELKKTVLSKEFLTTEIEIEYSNGVKVVTGYSLLYIDSVGMTENEKNEVLYKNEKLSVDVYDYESYDGVISCKIDEEQQMNVFVLKTFSPNDEKNFMEILEKCIEVFDNNTYPISVILPMNGGGRRDIRTTIEEVFFPQATSDLVGSVRISDVSRKAVETTYGEVLRNPHTCNERIDKENTEEKKHDEYEFIDESKETKYGDINHRYSQESIVHYEPLTTKRMTNNKRKPTDIMLFTDGYCFSSCSVLTKDALEYGNAIVVGYSGDPTKDIESFDSGNSPSMYISQNDIGQMSEIDYFNSIGATLTMTIVETFSMNHNYTETIPREFKINQIDERVSLFKFGDNKIGQFIEEAKKIHKKYQDECNPKNKQLVKYADECDESISIEHAHGGYLCGDDGKWTKECVPRYCDTNYTFDAVNMKCVEDPCYIKQEENLSYDDLKIIIGCCIAAGLLIIIVILVLVVIVVEIQRKRQKSAAYEEIR